MNQILIVEDESHIAHVMSVWLKRHGFVTREARNGVLALELLKREPVDLIISDMNMPVLDGLGFIRTVRETLGLDVPIVALSARCDQGRLSDQLREFGVELYPKPFMPSQLVAEIERLLGRTSTPNPKGCASPIGVNP